jgi:5-methylcytosine-specific restriction enzyme subunit McrC
MPDDLALDVGAVENPNVLNLCASVLGSGVNRLLRRGIDRGYVDISAETTRVRGRLDMTRIVNEIASATGRIACQFDELNPDLLHNRILRSTVRWLSNAPIDRRLSECMRETDRQLAGISTIPLSAALFRRVQIHRNNGFYAFLMRVCELVHASLLPDRSGGDPSWFRDILADENYMSRVFEEFVRNFYDLRQSSFNVARTRPKWNATAPDPAHLSFIPAMMTDATLWRKDRTIVIDAKYYRDALQTHYGSKTVHSENLYQLLAYLRGTLNPDASQLVEGVLIYPVGEHSFDLSFVIDRFPIRVYTLDLAQPTLGIESDL